MYLVYYEATLYVAHLRLVGALTLTAHGSSPSVSHACRQLYVYVEYVCSLGPRSAQLYVFLKCELQY